MKKNLPFETIYQVIALIVAIILVHLVYVTVVRPNADAILAVRAEQAAAGLMSQASRGLRDAAAYLPSNILEDLGDDLAHYPEELAEVNAERAEGGLEPWEFLDVEVLAVWALTYSAICLGLAFLSMRQRDL